MASPAAMEWCLGGSEPGSNRSIGSLSVESIKSNKSNSQDGTNVLPSNSINPKTKVEIRRGDEWANGFIVRDGTDPDKISVEKIGSPMVTISNLRWELDVRPCQPEPVEAQPTDSFDF
jgi:hypothetical protein